MYILLLALIEETPSVTQVTFGYWGYVTTFVVAVIAAFIQLATSLPGASLLRFGSWKWSAGYFFLSGACAAGTLWLIPDSFPNNQFGNVFPAIVGLLFPTIVFRMLGTSAVIQPLDAVQPATIYSNFTNVFVRKIIGCNAQHWTEISQMLNSLSEAELRELIEVRLSIPAFWSERETRTEIASEFESYNKLKLVRTILQFGFIEETFQTLRFDLETRSVLNRLPNADVVALAKELAGENGDSYVAEVIESDEYSQLDKNNVLRVYVVQNCPMDKMLALVKKYRSVNDSRYFWFRSR